MRKAIAILPPPMLSLSPMVCNGRMPKCGICPTDRAGFSISAPGNGRTARSELKVFDATNGPRTAAPHDTSL